MYRFLDGSLTGLRQERFVAHIAECEDCAQVLRELEEVLTFLRSAADDEPRVPAQLPTRIKQAVVEAQEDARVNAVNHRRAIGSPAFVATLASLFIAAVMTYVVMTQIYMRSLDVRAEAPPAGAVTAVADESLACGPGGAPASATQRPAHRTSPGVSHAETAGDRAGARPVEAEPAAPPPAQETFPFDVSGQ